MCLAIPGKITSINGGMADVDFSGISQNVSLDLVPSAKVGDYVLVHAGFAIEIVNTAEAEETLKIVSELDALSHTA